MSEKTKQRIVADVSPEIKRKLRLLCLDHEERTGEEINLTEMLVLLIEEASKRNKGA